jgi:SAM-dependent methyltransferase
MGDTVFSKEQFNAIYPDGIAEHYWNHARNRIISNFLKKNNLTKGRILEIGCARGVVIAHLIAEGYSCFGVELGDADPFADSKSHVYTNQDAFTLSVELRQSVDMVMLLDVIEHMENPSDFLKKIKVSYVNVKHILLTVPARQELWTNYDEFNGHFRRYDLAGIHELSSPDVGQVKAGYFNHLLYPAFWVVAKLVKSRETTLKPPTGIGIFIHRIVSLILQADYRLLPAHLKGTSIIALFSLRT